MHLFEIQLRTSILYAQHCNCICRETELHRLCNPFSLRNIHDDYLKTLYQDLPLERSYTALKGVHDFALRTSETGIVNGRAIFYAQDSEVLIHLSRSRIVPSSNCRNTPTS
ncbi:hypothetical protein N7G274_001779 [Stereocaulon virgatum]|uniref:Uncharacterized protein n=1 Tax=Stereocaulon virgatum TaxID=373712 RepID=A0ABR4AKP4_9LECA